MTKFFAQPLGALLEFIYNFVKGVGLDYKYLSAYAISIIITTVIFKLILLPLTLKQTKSMKDMQVIQPKMKALQEKYKNDKETLNIKTMELYKEHNVNPLGGCLPLIIQMPIIIAFFSLLREPYKYMFGGSPDNVESIKEASSFFYNNVQKGFLWIKDIGFAEGAIGKGEHILEISVKGVKEALEITVNDGFEGLVNGIKLLGENASNVPFFGAMLVAVPVLALLAGFTTYLTTKMSTSTTPNANVDVKAQATQNSMTKIMPIMIFFFALNFPAGLTMYWVVGNLFQIVQTYLMNKSTVSGEGASK